MGRTSRSAVLAAALAACLFGLIVGAKWATFDRYGSPMPDWDQWDAEAMELLVPWFTRDHFLAHFFHPHNEHRILLTKLQNLGLVLLNGQWDSRLEAATNALLHATLAVGFWLVARRHLARRWHPAMFTLIAALFALPLAWQNVLGGFHSQQYWLLLLSFVALVSLPFARTGSAEWWMGAVSAILALGSMASGLVAAAVVCLVLGLRCWRGQASLRATAPTWILGGIVVGVGLLTRVQFGEHAALKAAGAGDFLWSIVHSLEWPLRHVEAGAVVMWAPFAGVAWLVLRGGTGDRGAWTLLALGTWVLVQIFATAYARGAGGDYPASRYMDTLQFGALVNGLALGWLASQSPLPRPRWLGTLAVLWLAGLGFGAAQNLAQAFSWDLPEAKRYYVRAEAALRRYLVTRDPTELAFIDLPYPSADELMARLNHPVLQPLLPVPLRAPLPLVEATAQPLRHDAAFLKNELPMWGDVAPLQHGLSFNTPALESAPTWGSFAITGAAAQGEWRSAPVTPSRFPWLKFETAGDIGGPGVALELRDAVTDALLATVRPTRVPHDSWRSAYVRMPDRPFVVVARDRDPARWIAFSPPMEMGGLSYWAWQATKQGMLLFYCATCGALALGAIAWWRGRHQPAAATAAPVRPAPRQMSA